MNRFRKISLLCPLLCLAAAASAGPEPPTDLFERIERRNFWNTGRNAAGIRTDSVSVSNAELYGRGVQGGFRDFSQASEAWSAGARARTITHWEKVSMAGSFSFDHTAGRGMSGSMFVRPGYYPIDVLEFTPGNKTMQTYAFAGRIAADAAPRWRIGVGIEFASTNYAKRKDLRHSNYRLDMTLTPGVMYHSRRGAVGLSYIYSRNTEKVDAEEIGQTTASYYAFLDKGLMFGAYEAWTGSGVHLDETGVDGLPVRENLHGAAVQGAWDGFYADAEFLCGKGTVGERETVWFEFPSYRVGVRFGYRFGRGDELHFLRLKVVWMHQTNDESVLDKETSNGVTITNVYGSNRIFERNYLSVCPEYEWTAPGGEFRGGVEISSLARLSSQMYPYLFSQRTIRSRVYLAGMLRLGRFELRAATEFLAGSRSDRSRTLDEDISAGEYPYRPEEYYDLQNEWLTAPRVSAGFALRCRFGRGFYAEAGGAYVHGFNLVHIDGTDRWFETLKIGYTF